MNPANMHLNNAHEIEFLLNDVAHLKENLETGYLQGRFVQLFNTIKADDKNLKISIKDSRLYINNELFIEEAIDPSTANKVSRTHKKMMNEDNNYKHEFEAKIKLITSAVLDNNPPKLKKNEKKHLHTEKPKKSKHPTKVTDPLSELKNKLNAIESELAGLASHTESDDVKNLKLDIFKKTDQDKELKLKKEKIEDYYSIISGKATEWGGLRKKTLDANEKATKIAELERLIGDDAKDNVLSQVDTTKKLVDKINIECKIKSEELRGMQKQLEFLERANKDIQSKKNKELLQEKYQLNFEIKNLESKNAGSASAVPFVKKLNLSQRGLYEQLTPDEQEIYRTLYQPTEKSVFPVISDLILIGLKGGNAKIEQDKKNPNFYTIHTTFKKGVGTAEHGIPLLSNDYTISISDPIHLEYRPETNSWYMGKGLNVTLGSGMLSKKIKLEDVGISYSAGKMKVDYQLPSFLSFLQSSIDNSEINEKDFLAWVFGLILPKWS